MKINVLAFGIAREICGASSFEFEVPEPCDTASLQILLMGKYSGLNHLKSYLLAVNEAYAHENIMLAPGDEIAILPPVSGG
jgi:molybdopterin converting factor subunit 1